MNRRAAAFAALLLTLTGCGSSAPPAATPVPTLRPVMTPAPAFTPEPTPSPTPHPDGVDLDLTSLSATMVFAEVASLVRSPEDYLGKTIRVQGPLAVYNANPALGIDHFYTILVQDATACCQQGLEFIWPEGTLPDAGTELLITGRYEAYDFGGLPSYHIVADSVTELS